MSADQPPAGGESAVLRSVLSDALEKQFVEHGFGADAMADAITEALSAHNLIVVTTEAWRIWATSPSEKPTVDNTVALRQKCPDHGVRRCPECDDPDFGYPSAADR